MRRPKKPATEKEKLWKAEWQRNKYASMTPSERAAYNAYQRRWKSLRMASMTDEQRRAFTFSQTLKKAQIAAKYSQQKKAEIRERKRKWMAQKRAADRAADRAKKNAWKRRKRETDPEFVIAERMRKSLGKAVKRFGVEKNASTFSLIGCSRAELRKHLESLFLPGMTWQNYGYRGWHVDHVRPMASFNLLDPAQMRACFHFTNLKPLWGIENMRKGCKIVQFLAA